MRKNPEFCFHYLKCHDGAYKTRWLYPVLYHQFYFSSLVCILSIVRTESWVRVENLGVHTSNSIGACLCSGGEWEGGEKYFTHQMLTLISTNLALWKLLQNPILGALKLLKAAGKVEKVTSLATPNPPLSKTSHWREEAWLDPGRYFLEVCIPWLHSGAKSSCGRRVGETSLPHFKNKLCPSQGKSPWIDSKSTPHA